MHHKLECRYLEVQQEQVGEQLYPVLAGDVHGDGEQSPDEEGQFWEDVHDEVSSWGDPQVVGA